MNYDFNLKKKGRYNYIIRKHDRKNSGDGSSFDNKLPVVKLVAEDFSMPRTARTKSRKRIGSGLEISHFPSMLTCC